MNFNLVASGDTNLLFRPTRESLEQLLSLAQGLFAQGQSRQQVLEVLMPA